MPAILPYRYMVIVAQRVSLPQRRQIVLAVMHFNPGYLPGFARYLKPIHHRLLGLRAIAMRERPGPRFGTRTSSECSDNQFGDGIRLAVYGWSVSAASGFPIQFSIENHIFASGPAGT